MRSQTLWEARWIFAVLILITAGLFLLASWLSLIGLALILFTFYFFRDPLREIPAGAGLVVSAADGVVADIAEVEESEIAAKRMKRVGVFLSVFSVHTNRAPIAGAVIYSKEHVGKYLDARNPEATRLNACRTWGIKNGQLTVVVRQITGAIARRIVAWSKVGDTLARGDHFGMIRFGSRTEVYLPLDAEIIVKVGDRVAGGSTVIARLP